VDVIDCPFMSPTKPAIGAPIAAARTAATKSLCVLIDKELRLLLDERLANTVLPDALAITSMLAANWANIYAAAAGTARYAL
jgi:hypothetical protein